MSGILNDIPRGMCRVVEVILSDGSDKLLGDFSPIEALLYADEHNKYRKGPLDPIYWVYDDTGDRIRTEQSV